MAIQPSRYNNPAIGAAFENIAGMFAPPASSDLANWALAKERNQKSEQIAQLFANPNDPNFDRRNIAVGNYNPTQSFYAQDQNNATAMRGQDVTAQTSLANNAADNQRAVVTSMFGTVAQDAMRPAVPDSVAGMFGLPALPEVQGNRSPLSATEFDAAQKARLLASGQLTDDDLLAAINGGIPTTNVVGANGEPIITRTPDAVGQQAYVNKGAEAKPENAVALMPDGKTHIPAIQGPDGRWVNAQTKELLPNDIRIFKMPQAQGTAADIGLSKPTDTYIEKQLIDIATAKDTAVKLRDLIATSPSSQGAVGWFRGTAQNVIETGGELGRFFGGEIAKVADEINSGAADAGLAGSFDENIPAIEMLSNLLAFQYAKTTTGERLSNEMLRASKAALGLDKLDGNQKDSLSRLNQAIAQIESQEGLLRKVQNEGIGATDIPAGPAPTSSGAPAVEEWVRDVNGKLVRQGS